MRNYTVAITGGIGSGKSTVTHIFESFGYQVFSADEIYAQLIKEPLVVLKISALLGVEPKKCDSGEVFLDKKAISSVVFSDKVMLDKLNQYTHALVYDKIEQICSEATGQILFFEIPLLFESKMQDRFDDVIVVIRNKEERINSVIERSGLMREEVIARMDNQFDYDNLLPTLHKVIYNDSDVEALTVKVGKLIETIKEQASTNF